MTAGRAQVAPGRASQIGRALGIALGGLVVLASVLGSVPALAPVTALAAVSS